MCIRDRLLVPIIFIYPQFGQFDLIENVLETQPLIQSIEKAIGKGLPWDENKEYLDFGEMEFFVQLNKDKPVNEFREENTKIESSLFKLDKLVIVNKTLLQILQTKDYVLPTVLEIIILSKKSSFYEHFMNNFEKYLN